MYRKRKKCFLCDTLIYYNRAACKEHAELYNQYKDEQWCRELVQSEERQSFISKKECITINSLYYLEHTHPIETKPKLNQNNRQDILKLHESGMSALKISRKLNMKLGTVKSIIFRAKKRMHENP